MTQGSFLVLGPLFVALFMCGIFFEKSRARKFIYKLNENLRTNEPDMLIQSKVIVFISNGFILNKYYGENVEQYENTYLKNFIEESNNK